MAQVQKSHNVPEVAHQIEIQTNNQDVPGGEEKSDEISVLIRDGVRMPDTIERRPGPGFQVTRRSRLLIGLYLSGCIAAVLAVIALGKSPPEVSGASDLHHQISRTADIVVQPPVEPRRTINVADAEPCTPAPAGNLNIVGTLHPSSPAAGATTSPPRASVRKHKRASSRKHKARHRR
jgi:hypothetical protein